MGKILIRKSAVNYWGVDKWDVAPGRMRLRVTFMKQDGPRDQRAASGLACKCFLERRERCAARLETETAPKTTAEAAAKTAGTAD